MPCALAPMSKRYYNILNSTLAMSSNPLAPNEALNGELTRILRMKSFSKAEVIEATLHETGVGHLRSDPTRDISLCEYSFMCIINTSPLTQDQESL